VLPRTKWRNIGFGLLAILVLIFLPRQVNADFIPPYDVPQGFIQPFIHSSGAVIPVGSWTLQVNGTPADYTGSLFQTSPSQVFFSTGVSFFRGFGPVLDLQLTHPILASGTLSFDYSLSLRATGPAAGWNYGGYLLDGDLTQLPTGTGSVTLPVKTGDVFGFEAYAAVNCILCEPPFNTGGETTFTITNFSAPVPEPSVSLLCFVGAAAFLLTQARRRLLRRS